MSKKRLLKNIVIACTITLISVSENRAVPFKDAIVEDAPQMVNTNRPSALEFSVKEGEAWEHTTYYLSHDKGRRWRLSNPNDSKSFPAGTRVTLCWERYTTDPIEGYLPFKLDSKDTIQIQFTGTKLIMNNLGQLKPLFVRENNLSSVSIVKTPVVNLPSRVSPKKVQSEKYPSKMTSPKNKEKIKEEEPLKSLAEENEKLKKNSTKIPVAEEGKSLLSTISSLKKKNIENEKK